ncbi:MAG TPA: hypothetical protein VN706_08280 [Gemmatimonadaceae bacterium]|nr:hypothetical protein [Gemmatimonadaceae bacterium]
MRRATLVAVALCVGVTSRSARAQAAPPATDIFLAPLTITSGTITVGAPVNITHRAGYDNQPSFTPDGRAILFTSIHDDGQADIYRYDLKSKAISRITTTPESEYSPTVMPGGKRFSVIRVEHDSTQRLWSFAMNGSDPRLVLKTLKPVGYHAWIDADHVVSFVLGSRQSPNALVMSTVHDGHADTLARDIGRSLAPMGHGEFSFVQTGDSGSTLRAMSWPSRASRDLMTLPGKSQDIAWVARDAVIAGDGTKLLTRRAGGGDWREIADLAAPGLTAITRLAVSPDHRWLAIVAVPKN